MPGLVCDYCTKTEWRECANKRKCFDKKIIQVNHKKSTSKIPENDVQWYHPKTNVPWKFTFEEIYHAKQ